MSKYRTDSDATGNLWFGWRAALGAHGLKVTGFVARGTFLSELRTFFFGVAGCCSTVPAPIGLTTRWVPTASWPPTVLSFCEFAGLSLGYFTALELIWLTGAEPPCLIVDAYKRVASTVQIMMVACENEKVCDARHRQRLRRLSVPTGAYPDRHYSSPFQILIGEPSSNSLSERPIVKTAFSVEFERQDSKMLEMYCGRSAWGSAVLMVYKARNIFHCWCHISNESLNSSISNMGGVPYGLNGLGGIVIEGAALNPQLDCGLTEE